MRENLKIQEEIKNKYNSNELLPTPDQFALKTLNKLKIAKDTDKVFLTAKNTNKSGNIANNFNPFSFGD